MLATLSLLEDRMVKKKKIIVGITMILLLIGLNVFAQYVMPEENTEHEGTWLQWPHHFTYGIFYRNSIESTWIEMTESLITSENVHIVAYNQTEKDRIIALLNDEGISLTNIDFYVHPNDDVWVRDSGPIFVYDENDDLTILDWGFNGWGNDAPFSNDDVIPSALSIELDIPAIDLSAVVLEGGAIEIDGNGTLMATRSSVTHSSRNPNLTETEIENYFTSYLGITNFIWLNGVYGLDITDMHIDGIMRFAGNNTIVTMNNADLVYWELPQSDIDILYGASNVTGEAYNFEYLPLTQNDVTTAYGNPLYYKGSYCNYYIANSVVLIPNYNDPNDEVANAIIQDIHPDKTAIGIDVRNLYENGGMIHCVTQQQPIDLNQSTVNNNSIEEVFNCKMFPNPFNPTTTISFSLTKDSKIELVIYNTKGQRIKTLAQNDFIKGSHSITWNGVDEKGSSLSSGVYFYKLSVNNKTEVMKKMLLLK
jgi:agmatine deiminase